MKRLIVDCCIRGEISATRALYERCLAAQKGGEGEILMLSKENLRPLSKEDIAAREEALRDEKAPKELLRYARAFQSADEIWIAAPYWDLSFPSLLKVYLEWVSVAGITFGYEKNECVGYCKARKICYFSTCGGFLAGEHLGVSYVRALAQMFGIPKVEEYTIEGLDIDPARHDIVLEKGIEAILERRQQEN